MTLSSGVVLPADSIAELCRRYRVKELSVFGGRARRHAGRERHRPHG